MKQTLFIEVTISDKQNDESPSEAIRNNEPLPGLDFGLMSDKLRAAIRLQSELQAFFKTKHRHMTKAQQAAWLITHNSEKISKQGIKEIVQVVNLKTAGMPKTPQKQTSYYQTS